MLFCVLIQGLLDHVHINNLCFFSLLASFKECLIPELDFCLTAYNLIAQTSTFMLKQGTSIRM